MKKIFFAFVIFMMILPFAMADHIPTMTINAVPENPVIAGTIFVNAFDLDENGLSYIVLYKDGELVTSEFCLGDQSCFLIFTDTNAFGGEYTYDAIVRDADNNQATESITVTYSGVEHDPIISINANPENAERTSTIFVNAIDNDYAGISYVALFKDGEMVASEFGLGDNSVNLIFNDFEDEETSHEYYAYVRDASNNEIQSETITVHYEGITQENIAPIMDVSGNENPVQTVANILITAYDVDGIDEIIVSSDDELFGPYDCNGESPCVASFIFTNLNPEIVSYTAVAYDNSPSHLESVIHFDVEFEGEEIIIIEDNVPPTGSMFLNPINGNSVSIVVNAFDPQGGNQGIEKIELFENNILVYTENSCDTTCQLTRSATHPEGGSFEYYAKIYDLDGEVFVLDSQTFNFDNPEVNLGIDTYVIPEGAFPGEDVTFEVTILNDGETSEQSVVSFILDGNEICSYNTEILSPDSSESFDCVWSALLGTHNMVISLESVEGEYNVLDNMVSGSIIVSSVYDPYVNLGIESYIIPANAHTGDNVVFEATILNDGETSEQSVVSFILDGNEICSYNTEILSPDSSESFDCVWSALLGTHNVIISLSNIEDEDVFSDNLAFGSINVENDTNETTEFEIHLPESITVNENQEFSLTATAEGSSERYFFAWDINGDGVYGDAESVGTQSTLNFRFLDDSELTVGVRVMDLNEVILQATTDVLVQNVNPTIVEFEYSGEECDLGDSRIFGVSAMDASPVDVLSFEWSFAEQLQEASKSDSNVDESSFYEFECAVPGIYQVGVTVFDDDGGFAHATGVITVGDVIEIPSPNAIINASTDHAFVGETVFFDGSNSESPNGLITNYIWTLRDDSNSIVSTLYGESISYTFLEEGYYSMTLLVIDELNQSDDGIVHVNVVPASNPNQDPNDDLSRFGPEKGLYIGRIVIDGFDFERARSGESVYVTASVKNGLDEELKNVRMIFVMPELGLRYKSNAVTLRSNEVKTLLIAFDLPDYVDSGFYYPRIEINSDGIRRSKAMQLEVVE